MNQHINIFLYQTLQAFRQEMTLTSSECYFIEEMIGLLDDFIDINVVWRSPILCRVARLQNRFSIYHWALHKWVSEVRQGSPGFWNFTFFYYNF